MQSPWPITATLGNQTNRLYLWMVHYIVRLCFIFLAIRQTVRVDSALFSSQTQTVERPGADVHR